MLKKITWVVCLICLQFISRYIIAADIKSIGGPYVKNYPKGLYQFGNQNWSETKDEKGVMYFGNSEGLLSFDGHYWQQYYLPNHLIIRAVASNGHGKIYTGAFGEMGYWSNNSQGLLNYTSLSKSIPGFNEEVWKIYADDERVIFQTFGSIYIYDKGKMLVVKMHTPYLFLFKVKKRYFIEQLNVGLYELINNKLIFIKGSEALKTNILSIQPYRSTQFLIGTAKNGIYVYNGRQIYTWQTPANDFLKKNQLNNGVFIPGKYYAYGTILNGVIVVDTAGTIIQHVNKLSGLQNNTVLSLYVDDQENLWAGLDNGIDCIQINSPFYFYFDKGGKFGTVYSSIVQQNRIYLGTNQGLFYSDWYPVNTNPLLQKFDFKLIPGTQGQVWDLSLIDNILLCGHNDGTYEVNNATIKKVSAVNGGWTIRKLDNDHLVQGTYTGLVIYKRDVNNHWIYSNEIAGFIEPSRYVEPYSKNSIWVSHAYKGIYKVSLNADLTKPTAIKYYNTKAGLPDDYNIGIFNLNGKVVFSSNLGFYTYDDITDKFYPYHQLNKSLGAFASSNKIIPAYGKKYWFINHGKVGLADLSVDGKVNLNSTWFSPLSGKMVKTYESISLINNSIYLISVDDGFVIFNYSDNTFRQQKLLPKVLIRRLENISDKPILISGADVEHTTLPYSKNSIRITCALPYYVQSTIRFQYYLEGYSQTWSGFSAQTQQEFTNLPKGNYYFKVRAQIDDDKLTSVTTIRITILAPWYASTWAFLLYGVLLIVLYYTIRKYYRYKLTLHQQYIHKKLLQEKEETLKKQKIANEQKIALIKNDQLQADLESKSRELANSAMNIVYKNELLQKLRSEIESLKDNSGKKLSGDQLKHIQKVIDEGMTDERDWNLFETSFNGAHEDFFKKLKADHPDLVPNDLKLCAYLRMNMSSKEIASLLNITLRGVEIRRYRLRKKLNLPHDKNLTEFLIEL